MPIDAGVYSQIDTNRPERLAALIQQQLDPVASQERALRLGSLMQEQQARNMQLGQMQRSAAFDAHMDQVIKSPEVQGLLAEGKHQEAMDLAMRQGGFRDFKTFMDYSNKRAQETREENKPIAFSKDQNVYTLGQFMASPAAPPSASASPSPPSAAVPSDASVLPQASAPSAPVPIVPKIQGTPKLMFRQGMPISDTQQQDMFSRDGGMTWEASPGSKPVARFSKQVAGITSADDSNPYTNIQSDTSGGFLGYNKKTGKIETIPTAEGVMGKGGINLAGSRESVYNQRVIQSANAASKAMSNIMDLPLESSTGWFGGAGQQPGLLSATKAVLANKVTSQEAQSYKTMMAGVARNLAGIETSGLAPGGAFTQNLGDSIELKEGDTNETKLRKLAEVRQIVEAGLEPVLVNPRVSGEQKQFVKEIIDKFKTAVPFTHADITKLKKKGGSDSTIADYASDIGLTRENASAVPTIINDKGMKLYLRNGRWMPQ